MSYETSWPQMPGPPLTPPKHKIRVCFISSLWIEFEVDNPGEFAHMVNLIRSSGMLQTPTIYVNNAVISMIILIGPDGKPVGKMGGPAMPVMPMPTAPGSETPQ